ncbi:MAG: acyltransferase domain-containing protein, partial [Acidobacteria bacterium]|nr:acyltransferase domain-containing protein [Acidobacteriota bacterium]
MPEGPDRSQSTTVKRALVELRELRAERDALRAASSEPIAIVGMGCRFPGGADSPAGFWSLLCDGRNAIEELPPDRWDLESLYDPDPDRAGKMYVRHGGTLHDVDRFDAKFFGISPREAAAMDPQQRLLLEVCWHALEDGGIPPLSLSGRAVGTYLGIAGTEYFQMGMRGSAREELDVYLVTGGSLSVSSGRIAYTLGLRGPAVSVDTACSASLVSVHLACQSLRHRECDLALAGGVSLMLLPEITMAFCRARMLAADGRCKTFDATADGYVRSEGCGAVVLRRLSDALASGDRVYAVILGSAVNQDGRSSGLTVPNGPAQEAVIRAALAAGRVAPEDVGYVEAHGTGTSLGDPIELRALGAVFGDGRRTSPLAVGSVKTNLGHLEAAAGVAGLIKAALSVYHGAIPPHLHFSRPTPHVPWDVLPLTVPTSLVPWRQGAGRVAGVSSFGFSGTNAHVVIGEAPGRPVAEAFVPARPLHVLPLSARSDAAVESLAEAYADLLGRDGPLAEVSRSAGVGRSHLERRAAVIAGSADEARAELEALAAGRPSLTTVRGGVADSAGEPVVFLYTGQGGQYAGMGRQLYEQEPAFRAGFDRCAGLFASHLPRPIESVVFPSGPDSPLDETRYTQPALFCLEYALTEMWRAWGITPSFVMGHSLGEYVAACVAGVLPLEDAVRLVAVRGRLASELVTDGLMAAVLAGEARVKAALAPCAGRASIAAINGPENVAITGERAAVSECLARLQAEGVEIRPLRTSQAFHSPLVLPIVPAFRRELEATRFGRPAIGIVADLTGAVVTGDELSDAQYWCRHLREPVRFADAVATLEGIGCRLFVEMGPRATLVDLARQTLKRPDAVAVPSLRKDADDWRVALSGLAALYAAGQDPDWAAVCGGKTRHRVALPLYPFQRERHWLQLPEEAPRSRLDEAPQWDRVVSATRAQAAEGPFDLALATFPGKWRELASLSHELMASALAALDVFRRPGETWSVERVVAERGVQPVYAKLLGRWFRALRERGDLLPADGDAFRAGLPLEAADVPGRVARLRPLFADYPAILDYVERAGGMLPQVLTGRESALETLFPGGDVRIARGIYETSPVARYFNGLLRAAAAAAAAHGGRRLRLVEIGAGTGGSTAALLAHLPADRVSYTFTDVSQVFLGNARARFAACPFIEYALLDIERPPEEQGFGAHAYDVAIAANVLHATRDLKATIDHVLQLLGPGGVLLLYETTAHPVWFDVTTGLIEGWQRFEDPLRGDNPLIGADTWIAQLREQGFEEAIAFPETGSPAGVLGNHVILARGPRSVARGDRVVPGRSIEAAPALPGDVAAPAGETERDYGPTFVARLAGSPVGERHALLLDFVWRRLMRVLRLDDRTPPDERQRLMDLGIYSLMAVELRNLLTR